MLLYYYMGENDRKLSLSYILHLPLLFSQRDLTVFLSQTSVGSTTITKYHQVDFKTLLP